MAVDMETSDSSCGTAKLNKPWDEYVMSTEMFGKLTFPLASFRVLGIMCPHSGQHLI